jgi:hypothetical protein
VARPVVAAVGCPNTLVQLGPAVDMSFDNYQGSFPIEPKQCVSVVGVASFSRPVTPKERPPAFSCAANDGGQPGPVILRADGPQGTRDPANTPGVAAGGQRPRVDDVVPNFDDLVVAPERTAGPARSPVSRGPVIRLGKREDAPRYFIKVDCRTTANDGVRFSGFRLEGPDQGQQSVDQSGLTFDACVGVEVSNMEISGWGASAIEINDTFDPDELTRTQSDGGRITRHADVLVAGNFLHHNQHPAHGHAAGYGVDLGAGAWAQITGNVFDHNRHSIAASGNVGGYLARHNLVLRGGGYHGRWYSAYTHQFDVHGTAHCTAWVYGLASLASLLLVAGAFAIHPVAGAIVAALALLGQIYYFFFADKDRIYNCGFAGIEMTMLDNSFQYSDGPAIKFRGTPRRVATVDRNVFPHGRLYENGFSFTDAAIHGASPLNLAIGTNDTLNTNTYGDYGVCDFDGDGVDDLFLATGTTWWYSSFGEMHWSYMNAKTEYVKDLRFGYVDNDRRCDVVADFGGAWHFVSGGYGNWTSLGAFGTPLKDVALGRFDVSLTDSQPGATRRTTHAFRRRSDGQWEIAPLFGGPTWSSSYVVQGPNGAETRSLQSSGKPFDRLQFGDFTGDGVTDVLAIDGGHWSISESALGAWRPLNPALADDVSRVVVANMDAVDNVDDILKFETKAAGNHVVATWSRSRNGTDAWEPFATYSFPKVDAANIRGLAGRFGAALGGATLVIAPDRRGRFHGITETNQDWQSVFPY